MSNDDNEIKIPHHIAETICDMDDQLEEETGGGLLPCELMTWIGSTYPDLKDKYSHLAAFSDKWRNYE